MVFREDAFKLMNQRSHENNWCEAIERDNDKAELAKRNDIFPVLRKFPTRDTFERVSGVIKPPNLRNQTLKAV